MLYMPWAYAYSSLSCAGCVSVHQQCTVSCQADMSRSMLAAWYTCLVCKSCAPNSNMSFGIACTEAEFLCICIRCKGCTLPVCTTVLMQGSIAVCSSRNRALCIVGGDWGSAVSKALGIFHSENCRGIHVNFMIASPNRYNPRHLLQLVNAFAPYADQFPLFLSADEIKGIKGLGHFQSQESGKACLTAACSTCCSADKLTLPQQLIVFHVCISLACQTHFCILVPCYVAPLNLFPVCEDICHAKAISAPDCCKPLSCLNRRFVVHCVK